jgi:hypothetical protein
MTERNGPVIPSDSVSIPVIPMYCFGTVLYMWTSIQICRFPLVRCDPFIGIVSRRIIKMVQPEFISIYTNASEGIPRCLVT